jgi:hypothetical protein
MQQRHETEAKFLAVVGLPERRELLRLADADANAYFEAMFGELT